MRRRRPRALTAEERRLWAQVASGIMPLKGRAPDTELLQDASPTPEANPSSPAPAPLLRNPTKPSLPPLVPLERRTVSALRRGRQGIDAAVDLHGLRQSEAHQVLRGFLHRSQAAGLKVVLVITGKGGASAEGSPFSERGVLRRLVPHWLGQADLRAIVIGFEEAAAHHGGSGALYVRLRRARPQGR